MLAYSDGRVVQVSEAVGVVWPRTLEQRFGGRGYGEHFREEHPPGQRRGDGVWRQVERALVVAIAYTTSV